MDRFYIGPVDTGLQTDLKPYAIPDDAFERLQNAYVFRGRVRKRFGSYPMNITALPQDAQLSTRLRLQVGVTDAAGNAGGVIPGITPNRIGSMFSVGSAKYTVFQLVGAMLATQGAGNFDTATGVWAIAGAPALTPVFYYPSDPVMGLITYEIGVQNNEPVVGFDTQFAYEFDTVGLAWRRLGLATWTGSNSQFFWGATYRDQVSYQKILFVSNFNIPDGIKYYSNTAGVWTNFAPVVNAAGDFIVTARIIVPFKNRLVLLNTVENTAGINRSFVNRMRCSRVGDPRDPALSFREPPVGNGQFLDLPTEEVIVSAQILKDRLIVFCESSTWELVFINNQQQPFAWQQINVELGSESSFSTIPFDKVLLTIGNVGIHACNGANVERIDEKIPDQVFNIQYVQNGIQRVYGIRDYFVEVAYWTYPSDTLTQFPDKILVYNYRNGSWAINTDSITAFGYLRDPLKLINPTTPNFPQVIAGNQEGWVVFIDPNVPFNADSLQITNIGVVGNTVTITALNHNLHTGDYVQINNVLGTAGLNGNIYQVTVLTVNTFNITQAGVVGAYTGGGTLKRVDNIDILTKQYNFYAEKGRNARFVRADFKVDNTATGQISVDYYTSSAVPNAANSLVTAGTTSGAIVGNSILETSPYATVPYENSLESFWHWTYLQAQGEYIQLRLYFSDLQMRTENISILPDFVLNAMVFHAQPTTATFNP